jgi:hypothetical protein
MAVILVDEKGNKIRDIKWGGMHEKGALRDAGYKIVEMDEYNTYVVANDSKTSLNATDYLSMFNKKKTK